MHRIFFEQIRWCQIAPSPELPREEFRSPQFGIIRIGLGFRDLEIPIVPMHSGCIRVAWVDDEADSSGEEGEAVFTIWEGYGCVICADLLDRCWRQRSMHNGDIHTGFFEHGYWSDCVVVCRWTCKHAGLPFASFGANP